VSRHTTTQDFASRALASAFRSDLVAVNGTSTFEVGG
jgi:hypothetical protein